MASSSLPSPSSVQRNAAIIDAVDPVIRRIVRTKLRASLSATDGREHNLDALDVLGDIRLKIVRRLSEEQDSSVIASMESYAATVAYHTCSDYLRSKYPVRTRVRNAVRRTLEKTSNFKVWQLASGPHAGDWLCSGNASAPPQEQQHGIFNLEDLPRPKIAAALSDLESRTGLERLITHVFAHAAGTPVLLDDLVAWLLTVAGAGQGDVLDRRSTIEDEDALDRAAAPRQGRNSPTDSHWMATDRMRLLWDAIRQLLPWHRAAYLLNLREGELDAFPYYGVATIGDIGAILELQPAQARRLCEALGVDPALPAAEQFAACWRHFPVEDQVLGDVLGFERSQIIAYRSKAIERLRRMLSSLR